MMPFQNTGYKPPVTPDPRNYILEKAQPVQPFPDSYKTDLGLLGVYMQGKISDCVENGITLVKRYYDFKSNGAVVDLSRRFLAILTAQADGFPLSEGTSLEVALNIAKKQGICESSYLTDDHTLDVQVFADPKTINPAATTNALTHVIATYAFVGDKSFNGLKNAIYQNGVVILALKLDKSWWTSHSGLTSWGAPDILPLRIPTDLASTSGHIVVAYAYDKDFIYVRNSFGPSWGQEGHGWFGPEYIPYIYEAATIVDFTPEQVAKVKQANQIVDTVDILKQVETPANQNLIMQLINQLFAKLASIFS